MIKTMSIFSLLLGFGAFTGLVLVLWRAPQKESSRYLDAGLGILFGALLISRAVAVAVNWGYYSSHTNEIIKIWQGGLSGVGALAGGALAIFIMAIWWKSSTGFLADAFLPLAATLMVTAWLGCWANGCSYGPPSGAWYALPGRDEWGILDYRVPVQFLGAMITLLFTWWLDWASKHWTLAGLRAAVGLLGFSGEIYALSFLRADPSLTLYGLRLEAWGAIILAVCAVAIIVVLWLHRILGKSRHSSGMSPLRRGENET